METWLNRRLYWAFTAILSSIDRWAVLLLALLVGVLLLPNLGQGSLRDWDEAIYAQVSREIIQSGDWINLQHGYQPYYEKPPLLMWTTALLYKLFGINEFWARIPSAVSGLMLVWVTYLIGRELYDRRAGFLAGLILLSSYGFILHARNGTTNIMLSLFILTGIYGYLKLRHGHAKWWYLILGSYGLAFMVKLWAANVLPAIILIMLLLENRLTETLRSKHFWGGVLLAALIIVPWHITVYLNNPALFIYSYVSRNLIERTFTAMEGHAGTSYFYMDSLRRNFSPWYFLFPIVMVLSFREIVNHERRTMIFITAVLLIFALYSFHVNTKIHMYILPIYPALAVLTGNFFQKLFSAPESDLVLWAFAGILLATTVAQDKLLMLVTLLGIVLIILAQRKFINAAHTHTLMIGLFFGGFFMSSILNSYLGNVRLDVSPVFWLPETPIARIAARAGQLNPSRADPIIGFAMSDSSGSSDSMVEGPSAIFYSNRPVNVAHTWEELEQEMSDEGSGEIIVAKCHLERLSQHFDISVIETVGPLAYAKFIR